MTSTAIRSGRPTSGTVPAPANLLPLDDLPGATALLRRAVALCPLQRTTSPSLYGAALLLEAWHREATLALLPETTQGNTVTIGLSRAAARCGEYELLGLVAGGASNAEIARRLYLSPRTGREARGRAARQDRLHDPTQLAVHPVSARPSALSGPGNAPRRWPVSAAWAAVSGRFVQPLSPAESSRLTASHCGCSLCRSD